MLLNKLVGTNINVFLNKQTGWYKLKFPTVSLIMPKDGNKTRIKILDETTQLVLENGFAGTTIDQILARTQITKGAFFYHFKSKALLGLRLMEHFAEKDMAALEASVKATAHDDPKARLISFVQWFIDEFAELQTPYDGCLYASYVYEPEQFDQEIKDIVANAILRWREVLVEMLEKAEAANGAKITYDANSLADHFTVIMEGSFITSKALNDPALTSNQLKHYQNYLNLLFGP